MTQEELAGRSKLHSTYISRLEKGKRNPTLDTMESIAESLGMDSSDLLDLARVFAKKQAKGED